MFTQRDFVISVLDDCYVTLQSHNDVEFSDYGDWQLNEIVDDVIPGSSRTEDVPVQSALHPVQSIRRKNFLIGFTR